MDGVRVNLQDRFEVFYWCRKLRCTEHQLRDAVTQVGTIPSNVEAYIRQRLYSMDTIEIPSGQRPS